MIVIRNDTLFYQRDGKEVAYVSEFIKEKADLIARSEHFHGWKTQEDDGDAKSMIPRGMLWGGRKMSSDLPTIITAQADEAGFYFIMKMTRACGLFHYNVRKDEEVRFFHRENFFPVGAHIAQERLVAALGEADGSRHLVSFDINGRDATVLTSGDTRDEHPCIADGVIYYDSTGIGRDQQGNVAGFGPKAICSVTLTGESQQVIREAKAFDYIMPKRDRDGKLYALRMPYEQEVYRFSVFLKDVLLFPYNLAMAVMGFLNAFSVMFARRPIITSGGPKLATQDLRKRIINSRLVDIREATRQAGQRVAAPSSWKLVRLDGDKDVELAAHVIGYAFADDGTILVNKGYSVTKAAGERVLESADLITELA